MASQKSPADSVVARVRVRIFAGLAKGGGASEEAAALLKAVCGNGATPTPASIDKAADAVVRHCLGTLGWSPEQTSSANLRDLAVLIAQPADRPVDRTEDLADDGDDDHDKRDKWMYEQRLAGVANSTIGRRLPKHNKSWAELTESGVRDAIKKYCGRHELAQPPSRKPGRRTKKNTQ